MPTQTRHVAEVTDPVTGEQTQLMADTEGALEQLLDDHLAQAYPLPTSQRHTTGDGLGCGGLDGQ